MRHVRAFTERDLEDVLAIAGAAPEAATWSLAVYEEILANPARNSCLVAEQEGQIVGFVCFRVVGEESELLNLAVLPSFREQGVGSFLVEQTLQEVTARGATRIFLEVRDSNLAALRLYERLGFEQIGRRPGYYSKPPADALVLRRPVSQSPGK